MITKKGLGKRLKKNREAKGLSQSQLAKMVGITQSEISKMETGARDIGVIQMDRIARALDVDIYVLIYGKER